MKAILSLVLMTVAVAAAAAQSRPVVVELFTSQSCSSCPPADALLGELARRADVVALGFHVTYWDGAQWRDPFARQASTDRQIAYDKRLTGGQVYTPQMIIDGSEDAVGSDRAAVLAALARARPVAVAPVAFAGDRRSVFIGAATTGDHAAPSGASVVLARYAVERSTRIKGGENAGRAAVDVNAVIALTVIGDWSGKAATFALDPPAAGEGLAVLVQAADGRFLGAASLAGPAALPRPAPSG